MTTPLRTQKVLESATEDLPSGTRFQLTESPHVIIETRVGSRRQPTRIPRSARAKALLLANCGFSYEKTRTILAKDGHLHSVNGIRRLVKRIRDSGYFKDKSRSGRRSLLKDRHLELKEEQLQDDDESTSADLLQVIKT